MTACPVDTAHKRALVEMYEEECSDPQSEIALPFRVRLQALCMRTHDASKVLFREPNWWYLRSVDDLRKYFGYSPIGARKHHISSVCRWVRIRSIETWRVFRGTLALKDAYSS